MDEKIRSIAKKVKKDAKAEGKELKTLERMDKKRDRLVDLGKKAKKRK